MTTGARFPVRSERGLDVPLAGVACPTGGDPEDPARGQRIGRLEAALEAACPPLAERLPTVRATVEDGYRAWIEGTDPTPEGDLDADVATPGGDLDADVATPEGTPASSGLAAELREPLEAAVLDGIVTAASYEANALEARFEARVDADVDVSVAVDCDGFGTRYARRTLDRLLRAGETAAVEAVEAGANAEAGANVEAGADDLVCSHARVVSVAALLLAARTGVQAVSGSCGGVTGKRWVVPEAAPCPLHDRADGVDRAGAAGSRTVPVGECFPVPEARGVAASAFLVGEHRPFACSCLQEPVLGSFPSEEPRSLAALDGVSVRRADGEEIEALSEREREVYHEHAHPGETFAGLLARFHDTRSVRGGARELGVAKKTLYRWFDTYVEGFDRYNGR